MTFNYLIKFDENGRRTDIYVKEELTQERIQELLDDGFLLIPDDEYQLIIGNVDGHEYIRNPETGEYEIYVPPAPPLPELEAYKEQRKNELETLHRAAEEEAHVLSSLGFEIDAGNTANRDVTGIVRKLTRNGGTEIFMDYSNNPHEITLQDAETMLDEIFANAQYLYQQKWTYRTQIEACKTSDALSLLNFQFHYQSFYTE